MGKTRLSGLEQEVETLPFPNPDQAAPSLPPTNPPAPVRALAKTLLPALGEGGT